MRLDETFSVWLANQSVADMLQLVYSHDSYTDPMGLIPQTLASKMELIRQRDFYGGQIQ